MGDRRYKMKNVFEQSVGINYQQRKELKGHNSFVLWFTGLSGSGKSTLAESLTKKLYLEKIHCYMLDGDNVRLGINSDLDFSEIGRKENIRRIAEISKLFVDSGEVVLSSFVSPYLEDRENAKQIIGKENFVEVFVNTPLEVCERRDVKGLYKKARSGVILNFTGITDPYEVPQNPEIEINTDNKSIEYCTEILYRLIKEKLYK